MADTPSRRPLLHREVRFRSLEQAAEHPHAVDQEATVGRIMAAALGHAAIHPELIAAGQMVVLRQDQRPIIHLMKRLRSHASFQVVLGAVIGDGVIVKSYPALIGGAIPHRFFGLAIGPFLSSAQEG